jgi:hypothetical protein
MLDETKPKVVDCYELLTPYERKQISGIINEALAENGIFPEVSTVVLKLIIYTEMEEDAYDHMKEE